MLQAIDGLIFDLDGTLYRDDGDLMEETYLRAGAKAALDLGAPLTLEEARRTATAAFAEHGFYVKGFEPYGIDPRDYHFAFHRNLDETSVEPFPGLDEALDATGVRNVVILTHASREWAQRAVIRLGIEDRFTPERIIAFEEYDFTGKPFHRRPFDMALKVLGTEPERTGVIEDSARNLKIPHGLRMQTFLVNYRRPDQPVPPHAVLQRPSVIGVLDAIAGLNREAAIQPARVVS